MIEEALGITRVARVTGLDRAGVEVACAVRPGGHVLQVSNGKGASWEEARRSAISEAAELWASERVSQPSLIYGTQAETGGWLPFFTDVRIAWCRAADLRSGEDVLVPAQAVYCLPRSAPPLGPRVVRWTSNGMGAHVDRSLAVRHALYEAAERHLLPDAWTERIISRRKLDVSALPFWKQLRDARLEAHLFSLSDKLPLAGALLVDLDEGPIPLTAGYCAADSLWRAASGALLEAAQSRLTEVHGAREDTAQEREVQLGLREACERARPSAKLRAPRRVRAEDSGSAREGPIAGRRGHDPSRASFSAQGAAARSARGGRAGSELPGAAERKVLRALPERVALIELARHPLHVVRVWSPELRVSELL